jgi:hypothetical protein
MRNWHVGNGDSTRLLKSSSSSSSSFYGILARFGPLPLFNLKIYPGSDGLVRTVKVKTA